MFVLITASHASAGPSATEESATEKSAGKGAGKGLTARVQGQRMVLVNWLCDKPDAPKDLFPCMFSEHIKTTHAITDAVQRKAANEKWAAYLKSSKAKQQADFWKMHDTYCAQSKWTISRVVSLALRPRPVSPNPIKFTTPCLALLTAPTLPRVTAATRPVDMHGQVVGRGKEAFDDANGVGGKDRKVSQGQQVGGRRQGQGQGQRGQRRPQGQTQRQGAQREGWWWQGQGC